MLVAIKLHLRLCHVPQIYLSWFFLKTHQPAKHFVELQREREMRDVGVSSSVQSKPYECALSLLCPYICYFAGRFTICHKTEVIKNTLNPVWQPFTIPVRALCNGDYDRSGNILHNCIMRSNGERMKHKPEAINFPDTKETGRWDFIVQTAWATWFPSLITFPSLPWKKASPILSD